MANIKFTNFARTALAVGVGSGDVTMSVTGGTGALFPALTAGQYFYATLENATLDREIVKVTARSTDTLTVTRGQDNTTARAWVAGDIVSLRLNAAAIEEAGVIAGVVSGDLAFTGTANRIRGDFSNATLTNRVAFQTSTPATFTALSAVPTGTESYLTLYQFSDVDNCSYSAMSALNTEMRLDSGKTGVGSYLPMTFYTGGSERVRIASTGAVAIGHIAPSAALDVAGGAWFRGAPTAGALLTIFPDNVSGANGVTLAATFASGGYGPMRFFTSNAEAMRIDTSGNVTVTNATGGLGYGTGSGGTVTQATSKATTVTLNRPTGKITTAADALAPSARVSFLFNNSLLGANDVLVLMPAVAGGNYNVQVIDSGTGVAYIEIFNKSGVSQAQAIDIKFAIIKGATS